MVWGGEGSFGGAERGLGVGRLLRVCVSILEWEWVGLVGCKVGG